MVGLHEERVAGAVWRWVRGVVGALALLGVGLGAERALAAPALVSAGNYHSMAMLEDGSLWGWGSGSAIGDGTNGTKLSPVQGGRGTTWNVVAAGSDLTIAIKSDGTLWAWGSNSYGQLGDGTLTGRSVPTKVGSDTTWSRVAAGIGIFEVHSAALRADGTLWTWGRNNYGQLGNGTTTNSSVPILIGSGSAWSRVALGYDYTVAIRSDGTLWAWGALPH